MTKPFDINALTEKLKEAGLPVLEDTAKATAQAVFAWLSESAAIHENALVKAGVPLFVQTVSPYVFQNIDKIDGQIG